MRKQINLESYNGFGLFSDSDIEWAEYIEKHQHDRFDPEFVQKIKKIAFKFNWETINKELIANIRAEFKML